MSKPVFFIECSVPLWLDVAARLRSDLGYEPVYWTGHYAFEGKVRERFPAACFHANFDAVRGIPAPLHADRASPALDAALLGELAHCERTALHMLQRADPDESMTYTDRVRLFHRQLRYWLGMIEIYQPSALFLPNSPHLVYDYVLYELCKRKGVATVLFSETAVDGLICPINQFEHGSDELLSVYRRLQAKPKYEPVLGEWTRRYLARVRGSYSDGLPDYLKTQYRDTLPSLKDKNPVYTVATEPSKLGRLFRKLHPRRVLRKLWSQKYRLSPWRLARYATFQRQVPRDFEVLAEMLRKQGSYNPQTVADALYCTTQIYRGFLELFGRVPAGLAQPAPLSYLVQAGKVPEQAGYSGLEFWVYRMMAARKKIDLRERYEKLARPVDYDQPFIYHALHYQPEKSSCPEGDVFTNQFLVVDLLSKCAPAGWKVCVKEHPFQWEIEGSGEMTRSAQFYDDVAALPNVQLVPQSYSPFDLIDHARVVATLTGTSGWEAVMRGKAALVFGHAWYRGCEGVFYTPTAAKCRAALRTIAHGYKPDERLVRVFLKALEEVSFRGCTIPDLYSWAGVTAEENVAAFVRALESRLLKRDAA